MITHIRIRNFKTLEDTEFDLSQSPTVLIGPNNCGKTSILQALTMWHIGAREWLSHRNRRKGEGGKHRGVGITYESFAALVPHKPLLLWRGREVKIGKARICIEIQVKGETKGQQWSIGTEFDYQGRQVITCRPAKSKYEKNESPLEIADKWKKYLPKVVFLQSMSGLADEENKLLPGAINEILGKGKTADVLRNICYQLLHPDTGEQSDIERGQKAWEAVKKHIRDKFVVALGDPELDDNRGKIKMVYRQDNKEYDLASGGRGFHQTLLLLAYLYGNPQSVVLLDEPDAHLEIVRQRDTLSLLRDVAREQGSQLVIASHSEIVLRESAESGGVVSIVQGRAKNLIKPRQISQFGKLLTSIGWDVYNSASVSKHIIFVEGSTDRNMLIGFAQKIGFSDERVEKLRRANFIYVGNKTNRATSTFYGLREVIPDLRGFALFDRSAKREAVDADALKIKVWERNEIENYLPLPTVMYRFTEMGESIKLSAAEPLWQNSHVEKMSDAIAQNTTPKALEDPEDEFWQKAKMSDYLARVFADFYQRLGLHVQMSKGSYYQLVDLMEPAEVPDEVKSVIERIFAVIDGDGNEQDV